MIIFNLLSAVFLCYLALNGSAGTECEPQVCSKENGMLEKVLRLELKVEQLNKELKSAEDIVLSLLERRSQETITMTKKSETLSETVAANTMKIESTIARLEQLKGSEINLTYTVAPVGFMACYYRSESTALNQDAHIVFDSVITNIGGAYNAKDGKFTAPYRGMYVFHLSVMTPPNNHQYVSIVKDGVEVAFELADARGDSTYETGSFQWVVDLNKGSQIWIKAWRAGYIHGSCHSKFTGFLVSLI